MFVKFQLIFDEKNVIMVEIFQVFFRLKFCIQNTMQIELFSTNIRHNRHYETAPQTLFWCNRKYTTKWPVAK